MKGWGCISAGDCLLCKQKAGGSNPPSSTIDLNCSSYELLNGIKKQNNIDPIGER